MTDTRAYDMVTMNIIDSTMVSICREMGIVLMKTSYSTIFNEGLDFTCALTDTQGNMIAVAEFCPAQIGGMPLLIKTCAQEIALSSLDEGDVIIHNDPYRGGLHVPEHTLFKPFYVDDELMGFCVAFALCYCQIYWSIVPFRTPKGLIRRIRLPVSDVAEKKVGFPN